VFPLKDNIPTLRFPVVTVALIALNVISYFFWQQGGLTLGDPSSRDYLCHLYDYAEIPFEVTTKSGLMVGLGETHEEMVEAFGDLREQGVQVLTVGQYLRPTERHLPVVRYWHPDEFKALEVAAYALGFDHIAAGPLVRSSYHADQHVPQALPGDGPLAAAPAG
jgi:hypothetical protein